MIEVKDKIDSLKDSKGTIWDSDPHKDWYDYELLPWDRSEWSRAWCEYCYKPWIYGDKK